MKSHRYIRILIAVLSLVAIISTPAFAGVVSPGDDFYVLDDADVLTEETEGEIFFSNKLLEEACGAQIVVVTIESTGSMPIDDYAYTLFNEWGIGSKNEDNGFLLLMAIDDEDYYAIAGTGLDFKFSSGAIGSYLDRYLEPDFAKGNYDRGTKMFFEAAFKRISNAYNADVTVDQGIAAYESYVKGNAESGMLAARGALNRSSESDSGSIRLIPVVIGLAILLILLSGRKRQRRTIFTGNGGNGRNSFVLPFLLGRMSARSRRSTFYDPYHRPPRNHIHFGDFGGRSGFSNHSGFGSSRSNNGFGSSRSGFGSSGRSSFGGSGSGFGGVRGGGGSTRGGGAGRGRR